MFNKLEPKWKIVVCAIFFLALVLVNIAGYWGEYYTWFSMDVAASTTIVFMFSLLLFQGNRRDLLTVSALLFVLLIDRFIGYHNYILVVAIYFIFHFFCTARLYLNLNKKRRILDLILRAGMIIAAEVVALIIFKSDFSLLYFFAIFYFTNLVMNGITAILQIKINAIFFAGILIFILSDILVGLDHLGLLYIAESIEITYIIAIALVALSLILKPTKSESETIFKSYSK